MSRIINLFTKNNLMKKIGVLLIIFVFFSSLSYGKDMQDKHLTRIKLTLDNQKEVIVRMSDNLAVEQFLKMLPANFEFVDYAGKEKISYFSKPLLLHDVPHGMIASAGKMFIYVPWGNWGFFYKNHGDSIDKNLIELGQVETGLEHLSAYKNSFNAKIEILP